MISIGVDLGTTNSCLYYLDETGNPVLVRDDRGRCIFPSVVWCSVAGKECLVAHKAKARIGRQPPPVIAVKRKMGTDEKVMLGGVAVEAYEVSAKILIFLRALVETVTGDKVGGVVVTVPAYFDIAARRDTRVAAVKAFFGGDEAAAKGKLELQLEPEAAAYAYTAVHPAERMKVLVYDLGGGTFDVTVLEKTPEMGLTVLKFGGDPHLGGDNFDDRLALWILYLLRGGKPEALERILTSGRYGPDVRYTVLQQLLSNDVGGLRGILRREDQDLLIPKAAGYDLDLDHSNLEDLGRIQMLKSLAEEAKKGLTQNTEVAIVLQSAFPDHSGDLVDVDFALGRAKFDLLVGDMITKTMIETAAVVEKAHLRLSDFDRVLLVGGSSRMPIVASKLRDLFSCPVELTDPDLIVARGAAMRARFVSLVRAADSGPLALEYPLQTTDRRVTITGRLNRVVEGGRAYLVRNDGKETNANVDKDRFMLQGVELEPGCENTFHLDVLDGSENIVVESDLAIVHSTEPATQLSASSAKITKRIGYLAGTRIRELFAEGELLPATKAETFRWPGGMNPVSVAIYEGERLLRDIQIEGLDVAKAGAEIELRITIEEDYTLHASASVVSSGQKAHIESQIDRIYMPSLERMTKDKDRVVGEIEDALASVSGADRLAQFRRRARRLEAEYTTAGRAAEPDSHHLFSLIGEMKKLVASIHSEVAFIAPSLDEFAGVIGDCRSGAGQLKDTAEIKISDVMKKIDSLDKAGEGAWEREDWAEWQAVSSEAAELLHAIVKRLRAEAPPPPPSILAQHLMTSLREMEDVVNREGLDEGFLEKIDVYSGKIGVVDLSNEDTARAALIEIAQKLILPLKGRIDNAAAGDASLNDDFSGRDAGATSRRTRGYRGTTSASSARVSGHDQKPTSGTGSAVFPAAGVEQLHFTVASPSSVRAGDSFIVDIFAHFARQRAEVMERVRESNPGVEIVSRTEPSQATPEIGSVLTIRLSLGDCPVDPIEKIVLWNAEIGTASFVVTVPANSTEGPLIGRARVLLNGLSIGDVPFRISVGRADSSRDSAGTTFRPHRKAFASYASEDREQVAARLQGMQKIVPALEVFLDVVSLRSGDYWERQLWEEIPKNDVFYLFWSAWAASSDWVGKEWRCALKTRGLDFIDPVPLVSPDLVKPPPELSGKHFGDRWLFLINDRVAGAPNSGE